MKIPLFITTQTRTEKDDIKDGLVEEFYRRSFLEIILEKKPKPRLIENWKNGERDGLFETYRENGQLNFSGNCKNGQRDGIWEPFL